MLSKELSSRAILLLISTAHINFQTISLVLQNLLTLTDLKVLKLSLINKRGIPRREINLPKASITLLLLTSAVNSKCTARVMQHVKSQT